MKGARGSLGNGLPLLVLASIHGCPNDQQKLALGSTLRKPRVVSHLYPIGGDCNTNFIFPFSWESSYNYQLTTLTQSYFFRGVGIPPTRYLRIFPEHWIHGDDLICVLGCQRELGAARGASRRYSGATVRMINEDLASPDVAAWRASPDWDESWDGYNGFLWVSYIGLYWEFQ